MFRRPRCVKPTREEKPTKATINGANYWLWVEGEEQCRQAWNAANWKGTIRDAAVHYYDQVLKREDPVTVCVEDKYHDVVYRVDVWYQCQTQAKCVRGRQANA